MIAAFSFKTADLPDGLRFDGVQTMGDAQLLQFTELDEQRASYGASFYIDSSAALIDAVLLRREEKRLQFSAAAPAGH